MKSALKKYRQYEDNNLDTLLKKMRIKESDLYELLQQWLTQGYITKTNPHYTEIKRRRYDRAVSASLERRKKRLRTYQEAVDSGLSPELAAKFIPVYNLHSFLKKWVVYFDSRGDSTKATAKTLRISTEKVAELRQEIEEDKRHRSEAEARSLGHNRQRAVETLRDMAADLLEDGGHYCLYDIEAKQHPDEPIEFSIIDLQGRVLFDHLIRPQTRINRYVQNLTGITDELVQDKPDIFELMPELQQAVKGKTLLSWGSDYDMVVIRSMCKMTHQDLECDFGCAQHLHMGIMEQKDQIGLANAAGESAQSHRALDDCRLVLKVLKEDMIREKLIDH